MIFVLCFGIFTVPAKAADSPRTIKTDYWEITISNVIKEKTYEYNDIMRGYYQRQRYWVPSDAFITIKINENYLNSEMYRQGLESGYLSEGQIDIMFEGYGMGFIDFLEYNKPLPASNWLKPQCVTDPEYDDPENQYWLMGQTFLLTVVETDSTKSAKPASSHKVGDPLGDVVYSDITAYINGQAIPTSIKNGTTMVVVEDLANYGFDVKWDGKARTLKVELAKNKKFTPLPVVKDTKNKPGTFKCKYVYTDIKTYISGKEVESYAIAGVTLIDFELLKQYGTLSWNGKTREIKIEISTNTANINNTVSVDPKGLKKYSYTKFNYTFEWGEKSHLAQINKNAVGECILSFKVEGDLTGITAVRIANWQQNSFTEDAIKNITDKMVSAWKQSSQKLPDHKFDGNGQYGFPVNEDMRGKTFEVLLIALDKDLNPLGYIIVSVKIPAK